MTILEELTSGFVDTAIASAIIESLLNSEIEIRELIDA